MSPELLFSIANMAAVASWLLLATLPRRPWVTEAVTGKVVPVIFAGFYIALIVSMFGRMEGGFSTLAGVAAFFTNPWLLLAGWVITWRSISSSARGKCATHKSGAFRTCSFCLACSSRSCSDRPAGYST
jgi:hypothetical protein